MNTYNILDNSNRIINKIVSDTPPIEPHIEISGSQREYPIGSIYLGENSYLYTPTLGISPGTELHSDFSSLWVTASLNREINVPLEKVHLDPSDHVEISEYSQVENDIYIKLNKIGTPLEGYNFNLSFEKQITDPQGYSWDIKSVEFKFIGTGSIIE